MKASKLTILWMLLIGSLYASPTWLFGQARRTENRRSSEPQNVAAVVTRQTLFSIPFAVEDQAQRPSEIYLFVSGSRGKRWSFYQKRPARDGKFDFQAGRDGEYWFAVGTDIVRISPDQNTRPEKIVIVDTELPKIDLEVVALQPGRLSAKWFAVDPTLSSSTFRLTYQTESSPEWKRIDVILPRDQANEFDGEVSWMVNETGTIEVKAEIMDRAGNVGSVVRSAPLSGTEIDGDRERIRRDSRNPAANRSQDNFAAYDDQYAPGEQSDGLPAPENDLRTFDAADQYSDIYGGDAPTINDVDETMIPGRSAIDTAELVGNRTPLPEAPLGSDAAGSDDWRGGRTITNNAASDYRQTQNAQRGVTRYSRWTSDDRSPAVDERTRRFDRRLDDAGAPTREWRDRPTENTRLAQVPDPIRNQPTEELNSSNHSPENSNAAAPQTWDHIYQDSAANEDAYPFQSNTDTTPAENHHGSEAAQITNSKVFNLDYDVSDLGNGSLARVELWMTRNNGTTWEPYGIDEDLQSPFYVEVDRDGQYGFQLLIHADTGHSNRPPQSGDAADISIEVDTEKPVARITRAQFKGGASSPMTIEWEANDRNIATDKITLSYAETSYGPWVIIAREIPNTGQYDWQVPENLPRTVLLQIDVQDQAGNRTVHRLEEPTLTRPSNPRAVIKSIRTTGE